MKKFKFTLCLFILLMTAAAFMSCSLFDCPSKDNPPAQNEPEKDPVRYTVTEEEWNLWTTYPNYTIEETSDNYHLINKYTADALEFEDGSIIIFLGDKEYQLLDHDGRFVASDCTTLEIWHEGLLSGGYVYDEFVYNEELCVYELDLMEEAGARWEVKFENGIPVSIVYTEVKVADGVEKTSVVTQKYTNVGTTSISIPEYIFEEDIRKTVTEEEWNKAVKAGSFAGQFYAIIDIDNFKSYSCDFRYAENAIVLDGEIIVFEGDMKYKLEEVDGVWYATEWNEFEIISTSIFQDMSFDDVEYSEANHSYVYKNGTISGMYYSFGFEDGRLVNIYAHKSLDPTDPDAYDLFSFDVNEIGTVTIEVPEYVITK